eukprot:SAG31_NODE_3314_length_4427_cov_3.391174_6_plen_46_part_00
MLLQSNVDAALQPLLNEGGEFAIRDIRERHGAKVTSNMISLILGL